MAVLYFGPIKKENNKTMPFSLWIVILLLTVFAGIRHYSVGTDTGNYVGIFTSLIYEFNLGFKPVGSLEQGYLYLQYLLLKITDEYWILLISIAFLCVYFSLRSFYKHTLNIKWSVFIFITLAFYLFFFNGARQGVAAALVMFAFSYAFEKKLKHFVFFVILGFLFHKTVLVVLPFYFLINIRYSVKSLILTVLISVVPIYYLTDILSFYDESTVERYSVYIERGATGGELLAGFFIINSVILIIQRKYISIQNLVLYDKLLFLANIHSLIYLVVVLTGKDINLIRFAHYFSIAFPLIWPILFQDSEIFKNRLVQTIFVISHILFLYIYIDRMSDLNPYVINPNIF